LTDRERRESQSAAMLVCLLGCDALFDHGLSSHSTPEALWRQGDGPRTRQCIAKLLTP
jgi:hypothetical protein